MRYLCSHIATKTDNRRLPYEHRSSHNSMENKIYIHTPNHDAQHPEPAESRPINNPNPTQHNHKRPGDQQIQTVLVPGCDGDDESEEECCACTSASKIFREAILRARILDPKKNNTYNIDKSRSYSSITIYPRKAQEQGPGGIKRGLGRTNGVGAITRARIAKSVSAHLYVNAANICWVKSGNTKAIELPADRQSPR